MKKTVENRTMAVVLAELNASVDNYNLVTDAATRANLSSEQKTLVEEYNMLSLLSTYAECMKAERPVLALAEAYHYDVVSTKDTVHNEMVDGVQKSSVTRSVKDGVKRLDMYKFIEWTEEHNKSVAAQRDWKIKMEAARSCAEDQWKKFFASKGDTHSMSIGQTKKKLQEMVDSLVFIDSKSGKNAVVADGDAAKWVLGFANSRKDSRVEKKTVITGNVLPKSTWSVLVMDTMHRLATKKNYEIIFGDPEKDAAEEAKKDSEETK